MITATNTHPGSSGAALLRRTLVRNFPRLSLGSVLITVHQLCEMLVPVLIGIIVDQAVDTGSSSSMLLWVGILASLFAVLTTAYRYGARLLMAAIAHESHLLRVELIRKTLHPMNIRNSMGMHAKFQTGELVSIASTDADETSEVLDYVPRVIGAVVATCVCSVILLQINLILGLMLLIGLPGVIIGLQLSAPLVSRAVTQQQEQVGQCSALAGDMMNGHRPLQGIGAQNNAAQRYRIASRRALVATLKAARIESLHEGAAAAVGALTAVMVAITAAYFALHGTMSVGELITVIGLSQFLIEPFSLLAIVPSWVAQARASAHRVAAVLQNPFVHEMQHGLPVLTPGYLSIHTAGHDVLNNLSLEVNIDEFVVIVTSDPREAIALIELLSGRDRDGGTVSVDGCLLNDIPVGHRRSTLLVEHHHSDIFSGTLRSNLDIAQAPPDIIDQALSASCADDVLELYPDGAAHLITERGASMSGGQRQRWVLARALAADPKILVLHDPTTAVDAVTEKDIVDGIARMRGNKNHITLVLTSSPAFLAAADRVIVIADGQVVADGSHYDLIDNYQDYRQRVKL